MKYFDGTKIKDFCCAQELNTFDKEFLTFWRP